jgi:hypothetical protein
VAFSVWLCKLLIKAAFDVDRVYALLGSQRVRVLPVDKEMPRLKLIVTELFAFEVVEG